MKEGKILDFEHARLAKRLKNERHNDNLRIFSGRFRGIYYERGIANPGTRLRPRDHQAAPHPITLRRLMAQAADQESGY